MNRNVWRKIGTALAAAYCVGAVIFYNLHSDVTTESSITADLTGGLGLFFKSLLWPLFII